VRYLDSDICCVLFRAYAYNENSWATLVS
jgi:hypothetical protein